MTNSQGKTLSRNQERALSALVSQPTLALAAAQVGVTERTLYRWLNTDQTFQSEYLLLRREVLSNATYQLQKAANNAVNTLISVMNDGEAPAAARVGAAKLVLELAYRGLESDDLECRIKVLEEQIAQLGIQSQRNGKGVVDSRWR